MTPDEIKERLQKTILEKVDSYMDDYGPIIVPPEHGPIMLLVGRLLQRERNAITTAVAEELAELHSKFLLK